MIEKINDGITKISVWILKIIRWENTESNQRMISSMLGCAAGTLVAYIVRFILF